MDYGRAIRIVRTAHGLSKADLSRRLSVGPSHLSLIERGKRVPSVAVLDEISSVLRIPPHLLALLASEPGDLDDPKNAEQVAELARSLVRVLVAAGEQPELPISAAKQPRRRKSA
jgi:XRE family transcriptional regulator, regulator of sulfur utilization